MNTPSPLIPQGSIPAKGKSSVFFKVLMILTVHVVLIGGMLLQGCKDTKDSAAIQPAPDATTNQPAPTDTVPPATTAANISNNVPGAPAQPVPAPGAPMAQVPSGAPPTAAPAPMAVPVPAPVVPAAPVAPVATEGHEYVIVSGDTLGGLAHKNGVSLKALLEANPGVNPKKLHVGQKIQIPGSTGATASGGNVGNGATTESSTGEATVYTVKSGDTLGKIARANHTSYKKLMALNDMKTTTIRVGQKLKLPAPKEPAAEAPAAAPAAPVAQPVPGPAPVPAPSTASNQ
jgi:LysM repeat protein